MSTPDIHAETATQSDLVAVAKILAQHRGSDNPVTSQEIADDTGLDSLDSTPRTRGVIRKLSRQHDFPIGASSKGYFLIAAENEAQSYLDDLEGRIEGIERRKDAVMSSINRRGCADSSTDVESWVQDLADEIDEGDE